MFKGLDLDSPESINEGYKHAKNLKSTSAFLQNEEGNTEVSTFNFSIQGVIKSAKEYVVFTTSDIYWYDINDVLIHSFTTNVVFAKVKGVFQYNFKEEFIISFTDGVNQVGYANLTDIKNKNLTFVDYKDLLLFKNKNIPIIDIIKLSGGNLETGSYQIFLRYIDKDNTPTNFLAYSDIVFINKTIKSSIQIDITSLDESYKFVEIAVIKNIDSIESATLLTKLQLAPNLTYLYEGGQIETTFSVSDIIVDYISYPYATTICAYENSLFLGGLKNIDYNEQQVFNNISIKWLRSKESPVNVIGKKTFVPDEVYAFYVRGIDFNGNKTRWFLIPYNNIKENPNAFSTSFNNPKYSIIDSLGNKNKNEKFNQSDDWKIESGGYGGITDLNLSNTNVEHYYCNSKSQESYKHNNIDITSALFDISRLDKNILKSKYQKLEYGMAKKTWGNKKVLGWDIAIMAAMCDTRSPTTNNRELVAVNYDLNRDNVGITSTAGNFKVGSSVDNILMIPTGDYLRLHSPDLMIDKPDVPITNIKFIKKMNYTKHRDWEKKWWAGMNRITDYTDGNVGPLDLQEKNRAAFHNTESLYIEANAFINNKLVNTTRSIVNTRCEPCRLIQIANPNTERLELQLNAQLTTATPNQNQSSTYLISLVNESKSDYYRDYYNQEIVSLKVVSLDNNHSVVEGDSFICEASFSLYSGLGSGLFQNGTYERLNGKDANEGGPPRDFDLKVGPDSGHKNHIKFLTISKYDLSNRTELDGEINTQFWPKSNVKFAEKFDMLSTDINQIVNLDLGFKKVNITSGVIHNPVNEYLELYPYRVIGSIRQSSEEQSGNWKLFKALDYFELPKTRGKIINIDSIQDKLLIHCQNALFITKNQDQLESDNSTIFLSRLNLYKQNPIEILFSIEGYTGLLHWWNSELTKIGYIWGNNGKVFLFSTEVAEISQQGMRKFFRDNGTDNITITYDDFNERVIMSTKDLYTLSFKNNRFVSFHDYTSSFIFSVGKKLYTTFNNKIWKHDSDKFGYYYGKQYDSSIDIIFNKMINKLVSNISWITNSKNENGSYDYNDTFKKGYIMSENQCSGYIDLENEKNISNNQGIWSTNSFRDLIKDRGQKITDTVLKGFNLIDSNIDYLKKWTQQKRFNVNDWYVVKLEYNNKNNFIIKTIDLKDKPSYR